MKRALAFALFLALGVATTLAAVYLVLSVTHGIPEDAGEVTRALAISGALLLSTAALVAAVYVAVRLAVLLFDKQEAKKSGG